MTVQLKALLAFLAVAGVATGIFFSVLQRSGTGRSVDADTVSSLRKRFALVLAALLLATLGFTLPNLPYPRDTDVPDKVVFVAAKQFAFGLSETPINTEAQWEAASQSAALKIPAGVLVEFRVMSFDVNHGFGVYSPDGRLLSQTQAMPGYLNRLRLRLDQAGRYTVLCMELCGMEHHSMRGVFEVVR